jgi:valyl-tRNA synthetase
MAVAGRTVMLPLMDREIPLVADEWAKPELGTGCVKITPAHDPNDYEVGQRHNLDRINLLNPDGTLNAQAGPYAGFTVKVARSRVVADLDDRGLLAQIEDREIDLAHSDRSQAPIEPYLADQWFVRMDRLAQSAMDAVTDGRVKIIPSRYAKGYLDWLGEKRDWPVSRQLWWGHRIPIWSKTVQTQQQTADLLSTLQGDPDVRDGRVAYQFEEHSERRAAHGHGDLVHGATQVGVAQGTVQVCIRDDDDALAAKYEAQGFVRDPDVLDTWFSSALWPHSTLGWPDRTAELAYYYPTSVLITSREIITLWVARMVLAGLYNVGQVPFREVFIHPKILDGDGETMSKSKGNGVDPLDVIEKFGADALRFGLALLTTETQDVRMPVDFECPHCHTLIEQNKKNRELPRIACSKCGGVFRTQWATKDLDQALPRGAVVSERFELARNFCNKVWNASRFVLLNLDGFAAGEVTDDELTVEDRWVLSRLATVTRLVTDALEAYRFSEAARSLYDFAWDEFCSFYVEMVKGRLADAARRGVAQRVLAHTLDQLLRLLHPIVPFLTEDVWQRLGEAAPVRGIDRAEVAAESIAAESIAAESIMVAPWPTCDARRQDPRIEAQFARFQQVLSALRDIRGRNNIPPKTPIEFAVRCDDATTDLLRPLAAYFESLAKAQGVGWGPTTIAPAASATASLSGVEIYVDLAGIIDVPAEIARHQKQRDELTRLIAGKHAKLANASFVERAPAAVVQQERDSLDQLQRQLQSIEATLDNLRSRA